VSAFPAEPPVGGDPRPWDFPPMATKTLSCGLRVAAIRMSALPIVQVRWSFKGGRRDEPPHAIGAGRLLQSVMRHGTQAYESAALAGALDQVGARLQVSMASDSALVGVSAITTHLDQALHLADEVALRPTLPEGAVERERAKALEVHRHDRMQAESLAGAWLAWRLYGDHPYGRPSTTEAGLASTDRDLLQTMHRSVFDPGHALVIVVGDVDPQAMVAKLEDRYQDLESQLPGNSEILAQDIPPLQPSATLVERPRSQQTAITLGMTATSRRHPDYLPLRLANQVFGGGASSRLFMELRERKSLTYGAYSALDCGLWAGDLTASLSCAGDKTLAAINGLTSEVQRMADGVLDPLDLDHARRYLIGAFPQRASGVAGVAALANAAWLHDLPPDTWSRYQTDVAAVSRKEVVDAAQTWFRPDAAALVVVGAGESLDAVEGPLRDAGIPVERTDLDDARFEGAVSA